MKKVAKSGTETKAKSLDAQLDDARRLIDSLERERDLWRALAAVYEQREREQRVKARIAVEDGARAS